MAVSRPKFQHDYEEIDFKPDTTGNHALTPNNPVSLFSF
jgi:hypothetical protein